MPAIVRLDLKAGIYTSGFSQKGVPPLALAFSVDESSDYTPLELADGASGVAVPGIGSGGTDITTVQFFLLIAEGTITLSWNGANTTLVGTSASPAIFLGAHVSTTTAPTLSNSSGATVIVHILVGGT